MRQYDCSGRGSSMRKSGYKNLALRCSLRSRFMTFRLGGELIFYFIAVYGLEKSINLNIMKSADFIF